MKVNKLQNQPNYASDAKTPGHRLVALRTHNIWVANRFMLWANYDAIHKPRVVYVPCASLADPFPFNHALMMVPKS